MEALINIDVDDLDRALGFYTRAFDLRVGRRIGTGAVELRGATSPLYLLVKPPGMRPHVGAEERRNYRRHWTPVHLDFVVAQLSPPSPGPPRPGPRRKGPCATTLGAAWPCWAIPSVMASA